MITPRFSVNQDDSFIIITIRAPYCDLKELETYVDKCDFRFVCSPYYLRLNFPGELIEDDYSSGQFNSDSGEFIFKYSKLHNGHHFEGLEFITSLLTPSRKKKGPQIEVVEADEDVNEWSIEQKIPEEQKFEHGSKYGFGNQKYDILRDTGVEFNSVFDLINPDITSLLDRKNLRYDTESMNFSYDHFLADYFEDEMIKNIIKINTPWAQLKKENIQFNEKESDILKDFPNKEYLINNEELQLILCGLVDILYGYCYDRRTTDFEGSCESGWSITKLSATLSWFDAFANEFETITSAFRRSLIYPLYRNFDLCQKVLEDLKLLLNLGPIFIIKSLLDIYDIFNSSSDPRYIINDLYIKDYVIFMQKCPKNGLQQIIKNITDLKISKNDVNLNLENIIQSAIQQTIKGKNILEKMSKMSINIESDSSSDSESESDSSETSTDSDDDSSSSESDSSNN